MSRITVDFHNHLMPGADDGARTVDEARRGVELLVADGVTHLIAGVHIDASVAGDPAAGQEELARIDRCYAALEAVAAGFGALTLHRGAEIRLDTPHLDFEDERLRLAATRFVLVEFPTMEAPPFGARFIEQAADGGRWRPVLAHPERYRGTRDLAGEAADWVAAGAHLQLNHGSLLGRYGRTAQAAAVQLLEKGLVSYISSDFHAGADTWVGATMARIGAFPEGEEVIAALAQNGERLLSDELPEPVPPVRTGTGLLAAIRRILRLPSG